MVSICWIRSKVKYKGRMSVYVSIKIDCVDKGKRKKIIKEEFYET